MAFSSLAKRPPIHCCSLVHRSREYGDERMQVRISAQPGGDASRPFLCDIELTAAKHGRRATATDKEFSANRLRLR